jgi:uncharacterized membrane protein YfcA
MDCAVGGAGYAASKRDMHGKEDRALMLAALIVNAVGTMALYKVTSLWVAWLFYCLVCAGAGVAVYGLWHIVRDGMAREGFPGRG